jgi:small subunit ribosomal protein S17
MNTKPASTAQKKLRGTVVSTKMDKTIVVRVDAIKTHQKYQKQYRSSHKYLVRDEAKSAKVGDMVSFIETRPASKRVTHKLIED